MENVWGSQERWDLGLVRLSLECEPEEEQRALESGWLIYQGRWYQCRSVRIASRPRCDDLPVGFGMGFEEADAEELSELWHSYVERKGFRDHWDIFADRGRSRWLVLRDGCGRMAGFTKMVSYNGGMESQVNAYHDYPGLRIGSLMLSHEARLAHEAGLRHLYVGAGYERGSRYKAHVPGFEYWTGSAWVGDADAYIALCHRDSSVSTLDALDELWRCASA